MTIQAHRSAILHFLDQPEKVGVDAQFNIRRWTFIMKMVASRNWVRSKNERLFDR